MKTVLFILLFTLVYQAETHAFPLNQVQTTIAQAKAKGIRPVAIFDLDETLVHSTKRKVFSYIKAIERNRAEFDSRWPGETQRVYELLNKRGESLIKGTANEYDIQAAFRRIGVLQSEFTKMVDTLALPIYLSSEFVYLDTSIRGAVQLLDQVYRSNGKVFFVTARFKSKQYEATLRNIVSLSLFRNMSQSELILRNDDERSLDFKVRAFQQIRSSLNASEKVILVGENEPENMNAMTSTFPSALAIFVEGAAMNPATQLKPTARMIITRNFINN